MNPVAARAPRCIRLQSGQHLNVNFNPAALLTLGDALAFFKALLDGDCSARPDALKPPPSQRKPARLAAPENAPQLHEQMAQKGSVTSRVPQKYLIQNQSGLSLFYWGAEVCCLDDTRAAHVHLSRSRCHCCGEMPACLTGPTARCSTMRSAAIGCRIGGAVK